MVVDPYANLPPTDEPTHCTICRTNRNGPCKNLWRKFEYCMKDHPPKKKSNPETTNSASSDHNNNNEPQLQQNHHQDQSSDNTARQESTADIQEPPSLESSSSDNDNDEGTHHHDESTTITQEPPDDSELCNKYMMDWIPCIREHFMLYAMYSNQVDADYFDRTEKLLEDVKEWNAEDIDVDWGDYLSMLQSLKLTLVDVYTAGQRASDPLWEAGSPDPPAVEVFVRVNLQDGDLPIALCYARDDVGSIIGVGHFSQHDDEGNRLTENAMTMTFRPKATRRIRLYKVYEEELGEGEGDATRPLEKRAYVSDVIDLLEVARAAGKFSPHFEWDGGEITEDENEAS